ELGSANHESTQEGGYGQNRFCARAAGRGSPGPGTASTAADAAGTASTAADAAGTASTSNAGPKLTSLQWMKGLLNIDALAGHGCLRGRFPTIVLAVLTQETTATTNLSGALPRVAYG